MAALAVSGLSTSLILAAPCTVTELILALSRRFWVFLRNSTAYIWLVKNHIVITEKLQYICAFKSFNEVMTLRT
jgi:hypothetical protein